jgi:hypothetical protein
MMSTRQELLNCEFINSKQEHRRGAGLRETIRIFARNDKLLSYRRKPVSIAGAVTTAKMDSDFRRNDNL